MKVPVPREPNESARPALLPPARAARRGRVFCFLEGGPIEPKPASGRVLTKTSTPLRPGFIWGVAKVPTPPLTTHGLLLTDPEPNVVADGRPLDLREAIEDGAD